MKIDLDIYINNKFYIFESWFIIPHISEMITSKLMKSESNSTRLIILG